MICKMFLIISLNIFGGPMPKSIFSFLLFSSLIFTASLNAQDEMSADQKAWMDYMTPGPMHEMMAKSVGEWKTKNTYWMDPNGKPTVSEGTASAKMILGGRYLKAAHKGTVMGMPMEGINLLCYDNASREFTAVWIDNLGTGMSVSKGTYDDETKTIYFIGRMVDPMSGKEIKFRQTHQIINNNHQLFEMLCFRTERNLKCWKLTIEDNC